MRKWTIPMVVVLGLITLGSPWARGEDKPAIILATTTSLQDTGLLDALLPTFEKSTGFAVKPIAVGSGQAMAMAERGEADVLVVHSPAAEAEFMEKGLGVNRKLLMHNDFVFVGPTEDPAKVRGMKSVHEAFAAIAKAGAGFASRGDNSGTHVKEKGIWKKAGLDPEGQSWYQQTGSGMGQTLAVASEKKFYTLTDRSTVLTLKKTLALDILLEGDPSLLNVYHVIEVNPAKHPKVNAAGAKAFSDYLVSPEAQKTIGAFGMAKFGQPLFCPDAGKPEGEVGR